MSQAEVARRLGISRQAVCETEHRALLKLRAKLANDPVCTRGRNIAVQCRSALIIGDPVALPVLAAAADPLPKEIVWMPAGNHSLTAHTLGGPAFCGGVICDEQASRRVTASFEAMVAKGQRVWLDLDHDDGAAAGWVKGFSWSAERGIMASVEWTPRGESAIRNKEFFSFSPAFLADEKTGRVAGLIPGHAAGGLVNAPAFGSAMPALVAARLSGAELNKPAPGGNPEKTTMKEQLLAILAAMSITPATDATEAQLLALVTKHATDSSKLSADVIALKAKLDTAVQAAEAAKTADESAKNLAIQAKKDADAKLAAIEKQQSEIAAVQTAINQSFGNRVEVLASAKDVIKGYAKMGVRQDSALERGLFFKNKIAPVIAKMGGGEFSLELAKAIEVLASDKEVLAANAIGTLVGNLIAQQAFALLKYEFPILANISTDFSNQSAKLNQGIITRLKSAIAASVYAGTFSAANAGTTDVTVTINRHAYAQVAFSATELGGTARDLFGEQAEVLYYALGADVTTQIYALLIAGNYTTTPLVLGGTGGGTVGATGTGYARQSAVNAAKQLFVNKIPRAGRFNLLNSNAFGALAADPAVVSLAAFQQSGVITGYELPPIAGMQTIQVVELPTTTNKVAFAGHPRAIAMAARVPADYTQALPGASFGNVSVVTDPATGLSFMVTQYVNHDTGTANYRVSLMYGVAVGDPLAGVITYGA